MQLWCNTHLSYVHKLDDKIDIFEYLDKYYFEHESISTHRSKSRILVFRITQQQKDLTRQRRGERETSHTTFYSLRIA